MHVAGDAGHMTCTLEVVGSNVNDHVRAHEGTALSTNTIRILLAIVCAGRPSSAATGSRQRQPRRGGSSPSSRPCGGPFAFRRPVGPLLAAAGHRGLPLPKHVGKVHAPYRRGIGLQSAATAERRAIVGSDGVVKASSYRNFAYKLATFGHQPRPLHTSA